MNKKYVMVGGLAFSEEKDMDKLKKYAKEGWMLEGIAFGLFYKFKKDEPKDIDYNLDYQSEADEEYFSLFLDAGWMRVVSIGNEMHIFSAPEGTKPIYSDKETEVDKYTRIKKKMGKGAIYSLIAMVTFAFVLEGATAILRPIFIAILILFFVTMFSFVFNFMPYVAYTYRLRKIGKNNIK